MGNLCGPCFRGSADTSDLITPDADTRRRQMAEAAERRQQEQQHRGIKNPESVKRMQEKTAETERLERELAMAGGNNQPALKWTQG
ncbi:small VCP/p97-interacting protein [Chironomus tepperi]|uniref:small VCP/p97-interacting protein n=1 Tax=Chironomus tepperi TaxID=113505 RepID=UPI00391F3957